MRCWAWVGVLTALAAPHVEAGTVTGAVAVLEKDGRPAKDASEAVVWIEGTPARPKPTSATVDMKSKAFVPRVSVVTLGSTVAFPNQDSIFHNVFSVSGPNRFDLELYKKPKSASKTFTAPGVVRIYCNIHPQMSGFVLVLDSPYWARVGADGRFSIPDVPAGSFTLKAWHERAGEVAQPVKVPESGAVEAALSLDASQWKRAPHKNKYGKDYPAAERY
jgi:plastocyanin